MTDSPESYVDANGLIHITIHPKDADIPTGAVSGAGTTIDYENAATIYSITTSPVIGLFQQGLETAGTAGAVASFMLSTPGEALEFAANFQKVTDSGGSYYKATIVSTGQVYTAATFGEVLTESTLAFAEGFTGIAAGVPLTVAVVVGASVIMATGYDPINDTVGETINGLYNSVSEFVNGIFGTEDRLTPIYSALISNNSSYADTDTVQYYDGLIYVESDGAKISTMGDSEISQLISDYTQFGSSSHSLSLVTKDATDDTVEVKGIFNGDATDALDKIGANYDENDFRFVTHDSETDSVYSLVDVTAEGTVSGNTYVINDVLGSIQHAAQTSMQFVNDTVGSFLSNTFDTYNVYQSMTQFFAQYGQQLATGDLSAGDAVKYFAIQLAEGGLSDTIMEGLLSPEMIALRDGLRNGVTGTSLQTLLDNVEDGDDELGYVLNKLGLDNTGHQLSIQVADAFVKMAVEFALHAGSWDSDDYVNAGSAIVTGIAISNFVSANWGGAINANLGAGATEGTVAALTTLAVSLINDGFNQDWGALATSTGMAFGTTYATIAIGSSIAAGSGLGFASGAELAGAVGASLGFGGGVASSGVALLAGGAALAGIGIVVALAGSQIISSIYHGVVYHAGEAGDPSVIINSQYQVQDIDDGHGGTVKALVAVNPSGSTVIASGDIGYIVGGSGDDVLVENQNMVASADVQTIVGNAGADYIESHDGADNLLGGDGNDILNAGVGDDILQGDAGDDTLFGEDGNDIIIAGTGNDFAHGGSGDDIISGGDGNDMILAAEGNDAVSGDAGNDTLDGGYGDDSITGGDGDDLILGNLGNDAINGDAGSDTIFGDVGTDLIYGGDGNLSRRSAAKADDLPFAIAKEVMLSQQWVYMSGASGNFFMNRRDA